MIPSTWRDATEDVCPMPRRGLRLPTREEAVEAENDKHQAWHSYHIEPVRCPQRKPHTPSKFSQGYNQLIDMSHLWCDKYESEREWILALLREHKQAIKVAQVLGVSYDWVGRRVRKYQFPMIKGKGYAGD